MGTSGRSGGAYGRMARRRDWMHLYNRIYLRGTDRMAQGNHHSLSTLLWQCRHMKMESPAIPLSRKGM